MRSTSCGAADTNPNRQTRSRPETRLCPQTTGVHISFAHARGRVKWGDLSSTANKANWQIFFSAQESTSAREKWRENFREKKPRNAK